MFRGCCNYIFNDVIITIIVVLAVPVRSPPQTPSLVQHDNRKIVSSHSVDSKEVVKTSLVKLMSYCRSLLLLLSIDNPALSEDRIGLSTDDPVIDG
jgi:hypothetical protein